MDQQEGHYTHSGTGTVAGCVSLLNRKTKSVHSAVTHTVIVIVVRHEIILGVVAKEGAVPKAVVGVWGCRLWPPRCTGNPHTGFCNQRRMAVPAGHPERSGVSSAFQRCPDTRWTGSCPLLHDHLCPACHFPCRGSSPPGDVAHPVGAEGLRRGPGPGLRMRTGT